MKNLCESMGKGCSLASNGGFVCIFFMSNMLLFIVYFAFSIPFVKDGELGVG